MQHGIEEAVLKSFNEDPERLALACQGFANKFRFGLQS